MKNKNFTDLLALPWTYTIKTAKDENNNTIYIVSVNELPGATTKVKKFQFT